MTSKAKELLSKMVQDIACGHDNNFDDLELACTAQTILELERLGMVEIRRGIYDSIVVTPAGFNECAE